MLKIFYSISFPFFNLSDRSVHLKLKNKFNCSFFILALFLVFSCNTTEPPPNGDKPNLTLKLEDVSCIEAWIELTTTNLHLPATVTLMQDGETRETLEVITADTLLYIDSLLPNTSYIFQSINQPI